MINNIKKAIIISGGHGTRLNPITAISSKQALPIYDKPLIYYPLSILFLLQIKDILIISDPKNILLFKKLLGNGKKFGVKFRYQIQKKPKGIAHALKISREFIKNNKICVILGDNIFHGKSFINNIKKSTFDFNGANIFGYYMKNPNNYGVIKFNKKNDIIKIVEKPKKNISNYAIPGIYFFDQKLEKFLKNIKISNRGEYEIVDILKLYLKNKNLKCTLLKKNLTWLDTGNPDNLLSASNYIKSAEHKQETKIASLEEIAFKNRWITKKIIKSLINKFPKSAYYQYLKSII